MSARVEMLEISPEEYRLITEKSAKGVPEMLAHVYGRYPWLRKLLPGTEVKVIVHPEWSRLAR